MTSGQGSRSKVVWPVKMRLWRRGTVRSMDDLVWLCTPRPRVRGQGQRSYDLSKWGYDLSKMINDAVEQPVLYYLCMITSRHMWLVHFCSNLGGFRDSILSVFDIYKSVLCKYYLVFCMSNTQPAYFVHPGKYYASSFQWHWHSNYSEDMRLRLGFTI